MLAERPCISYRPVARIGRAPVSKTGCWGFESLLACQILIKRVTPMATETLVERSSFLEKLRIRQITAVLCRSPLEMKKVSWPGRKEVYGTTIVVICAVFFFGIYLGLVDLVLRLGVESSALQIAFSFFRLDRLQYLDI